MRVLDRLLSEGWIDQAYAKKRGINRLPALIYRLRASGYNIIVISNGRKSKYMIGEP